MKDEYVNSPKMSMDIDRALKALDSISASLAYLAQGSAKSTTKGIPEALKEISGFMDAVAMKALKK